MSSSEDKLEHLYNKAVKYHRKDNTPFNDPFKVYSEKLFMSLYGGSIPDEEKSLRYSIFRNLLNSWIEDSKSFSKQKFLKELNFKLNRRHKKTHTFYFGVHIKRSPNTPFPFKKQCKISGITFKIVSLQSVIKASKGVYIDNLIQDYKKQNFTDNEWIQNTINNDYIYFKAITTSIDEVVAANKIMGAFELFTAAASLAQERHSRVQYWSYEGIKNRKPIQNPYMLFWKEAKDEITSIMVDLGSNIKRPEGSLTFTQKKEKMNLFKIYLSILAKQPTTPIETRIKDFSLEFDKALDVKDPHLRMLSMWRCLEVATRLSNGATRRHKDIINILSKYYTNDYWKEKGDLVLSLRNSYVHEGKQLLYSNRDDYLGWVQDYASASLSQLMWMRNKSIGIKNAYEIDAFFDLYTKSSEVFNVAKKMSNEMDKSNNS